MLSTKMLEALNEQINKELYSAYLYLSMSAFLDDKDLPGYAHWMRIQAQEELTHVDRFYTYITNRHGRVLLKAVAAPETEWKSALAVAEATLKHEQAVTASIAKLVDLAVAESDHSTKAMLEWFVTEQVEEEAAADRIIKQIKMVGDFGPGMFLIDRELGNRKMGGGAPAADAT